MCSIVDEFVVPLYHVCCLFAQIQLLIQDGMLKTKIAMSAVYRLVQRGSAALIGPSTSGSTMEVSRWLSTPSIARALIGYSATSPKLSDPGFSNFLRTPVSDDLPAKVMARLIKGQLLLRVVPGYVCV